jgi:hypothetical protein
MDQSHVAFNELTALGVIVAYDDVNVRLNVNRLLELGYVLVFNFNEPYFIQKSDLGYMYDTIMYIGDTIPRTSLNTYTVCKIKNCRFSP